MSMDNDLDVVDDLLAEDTVKDKYLTFIIEEEEYGIEISQIVEIISISDITRVPEVESYVKGIINLRGSVIPVIDVRERFRKAPKEYDSLTCIVVIEYGEYTIGLIVDRVSEVMYIPESQISTPPKAKLSFHNRFIKNIGKVGQGVKLLLDLDKFLQQDNAM